MPDGDHPPAILTSEQRKFVRGMIRGELDESLSPEAIRQRRYRIRKRLRNGFWDFKELLGWGGEDMDLISDEISETPAGFRDLDAHLDPAVLGVLTFLYRCLGDDVFRTAVEMVVESETSYRLRHKQQKLADIDVSVTVSLRDEKSAEELVERFDANDELSDRELLALSYWGRISAEEYNERTSANASEMVTEVD